MECASSMRSAGLRRRCRCDGGLFPGAFTVIGRPAVFITPFLGFAAGSAFAAEPSLGAYAPAWPVLVLGGSLAFYIHSRAAPAFRHCKAFGIAGDDAGPAP
jgi:hypothetical protein